MRALLGFAALVLAGCATAAPSVMIPVTGQTPVEEQILASYRTYASVNASVGASQIVYSTDIPESLGHYQTVIRQRIARDLAGIYRRPVHNAERVYLLYGKREGRDLVEVIRLGASDDSRPNRQTFDSLYDVGPLTYIFDPATHALLGVYGPVAGEY